MRWCRPRAFRHERRAQGGGGRGDAAPREQLTELVHRPVNPHSGRIFRDRHALADFGERSALEKTKEQCSPITVVQSLHRVIELGTQGFSGVGSTGRIEVVLHDCCGVFTPLLPAFLPNRVAHDEAGRQVEPADEVGMADEFWRLLRDQREHRLRHVLRSMGVAPQLAKCRSIDDVHVALHQFGERLLCLRVGIAPQQLIVGSH